MDQIKTWLLAALIVAAGSIELDPELMNINEERSIETE